MDIFCRRPVVYLHLLIRYSFVSPLNLPWYLRLVFFFLYGIGAVDQCITYLSSYEGFSVFLFAPKSRVIEIIIICEVNEGL